MLEYRLTMDSTTLRPIDDNAIYKTSTERSNGAGEHLFVGRSGTQSNHTIHRSLLKFDVRSAVPAGAHIDGVSLTLNMSRTNSGAQNVELHRVLADWGEGNSDAAANEGAGATTTTNDASWKFRIFPSSSWATQGGDFDATASATLSVNAIGKYTWSSTGMTADVQKWVDDASSQFGWILLGDEVTDNRTKRFDSKEVTTDPTNNRPTLVVNYSLPSVNHAPTVNATVPDQFAIAGDPFTLNIPQNTFSDQDGDNLVLSMTQSSGAALPTWLTFNNTTNRLTGTGTDNDAGDLSLRVTASDGGSPSLQVTTDVKLLVVTSAAPWRNPTLPLDVNRDGAVAPLDALLIINEINLPTVSEPGTFHLSKPTSRPSFFLDTNGDNSVAPIDILLIVNEINSHSSTGEGESESDVPMPDRSFNPAALDWLMSDNHFAEFSPKADQSLARIRKYWDCYPQLVS